MKTMSWSSAKKVSKLPDAKNPKGYPQIVPRGMMVVARRLAGDGIQPVKHPTAPKVEDHFRKMEPPLIQAVP